jgi:hypothetical protein
VLCCHCVCVSVCGRVVMSRREGSSGESGGMSQPLLQGIADDDDNNEDRLEEDAHSQHSPLLSNSTHT